MEQGPEITRLLKRWAEGDRTAGDELMPLVYGELRKLAKRYMERQGAGHTLQPTAVVHEAYLKLAGAEQDWQNRSHFFGVAATAMRHILVDHARASRSAKRGGDVIVVPLDEGSAVSGGDSASELLELDAALTALSKLFPRKAQVVEMRCFGGLSVEETARALGISPETAMRDWQFAKGFLRREMMRGEGSRGGS
jgi:RNA polymerase sigma factor (TIGR02999 family)